MNRRAVNQEREKTAQQLIGILMRMGYPREFGAAVTEQLRTEKAMGRMIGYLKQAKPSRPEEIADEMIAIMEERESWIRKKTAEYNNRKYNELLNSGLDEDE